MDITIPGVAEVRAALAPLTLKQLDQLEQLSGVPATTIYKIKRGETENPGVETLRKFLPHLATVLGAEAPTPAPIDRGDSTDAQPELDADGTPFKRPNLRTLHPDGVQTGQHEQGAEVIEPKAAA